MARPHNQAQGTIVSFMEMMKEDSFDLDFADMGHGEFPF